MNKIFALIGLLIVTYIAVGLIMPTDEELRAYNVISECWDEELEICKDENKGDDCTFGVNKVCAAKHPEMQTILDGRQNDTNE